MRPMSTKRLAAVLATVVVSLVATAGPAAADAPSTWEDAPEQSLLDMLILLFGIPLALFVVIGLLAALLSRKNYVPPAPETALVPAGDKAPVQHH